VDVLDAALVELVPDADTSTVEDMLKWNYVRKSVI
jgi:hypothetical protein